MANEKTPDNRSGKAQGSADRQTGPAEKSVPQAVTNDARTAPKSDPQSARTAVQPDPRSAADSARPRKRRPPHRSVRSDRPAESDRQAASDRKAGNDRRAARNDRNRKGAAANGKSAADSAWGRWTWRDYALQFSVVFLGVLVTFIGSGIVERWRTQRAVRTVMQLVYEELKTNRANIERTCRDLEYERRGIVLMQENGLDYTRVPIDSLDKYQFILSQMPYFTPQSDALEMLRSSGTMIAVDDKQLLLEILGCYTSVNSFAASVESYTNQKMNALNHLFAGGTDFYLGGDDPLASWKSMMDDPMCAAFIGVMGSFFGREQLNGGAVAGVDKVIAALNEKYRFDQQDARKQEDNE